MKARIYIASSVAGRSHWEPIARCRQAQDGFRLWTDLWTWISTGRIRSYNQCDWAEGRTFYRAVTDCEDERPRPRRENRLHRVALKADALLRELEQLEDDARLQLGLHLIRFRRWGDTLSAEEVQREIRDLLDDGELANCAPAVAAAIKDVEAIENAAKTKEWPANPKGGRKKKRSIFEPGFGVLSRISFSVFSTTFSVNGGKTSFRQDMRTGSLVEILRTAMPFLPDDIDAPIWLRDADSQSTSGADRIQTIKHKAGSSLPARRSSLMSRASACRSRCKEFAGEIPGQKFRYLSRGLIGENESILSLSSNDGHEKMTGTF